MAISATIKHCGMMLPAAYFRITRIFGGADEGLNCVVSVYVSEDARKSGEQPLKTYNLGCAYTVDNPVKSLYDALFASDELKDANPANC